MTSSDKQTIGRFEVTPEQLVVRRERVYSCAHPDLNDAEPATLHLRYRLEEGELWLGAEGKEGVDLSLTPRPEPRRWMVFRPVSESGFFQDYLLRLCQDGGHESRCFEGCLSREYGASRPSGAATSTRAR